MKYLKYIVGLIAILFLLFIAKGFLTPSISYSSEIIVNKSVKEAWAVMNDESKLTQWLQGITKIEHIDGVKGTVGAVTKYTFSENGQESVVFETIKSINPEQQIKMDFVMKDVMEMDYTVDFVEKNGKTHINSSTTTKGSGMIMRSIVSFLTGSMQIQEDENMANLKKLIDENKTNYFPSPVEEFFEQVQQ